LSGIPFVLLDLFLASRAASAGASANDAGGNGDGLLKLLKSLRLLRFVKLARLFKLKEMASQALRRDTLDRLEDFLNEGSTRSLLLLASLALRLGFVVHLAACGWVLVGRQSDQRGDDSWLANDLGGGFRAGDTEGGPYVDSIYIAAFYYVLTTMTSVGYGDVLPRNDTERIYAIVLEFLGAFIFAVIIANLTAVVTSADTNTRKTAEQLDAVSSFVATRQFPTALGQRIRRHFRQFYAHKSAIDERKIFSEMSGALRRDVAVYIVSVRMSDVKLFQTMPAKLWPKLFPVLNPTTFELGEMVCLQDDECAEMFIVLEGSLQGWTVLGDAGVTAAAAAAAKAGAQDPAAVLAQQDAAHAAAHASPTGAPPRRNGPPGAATAAARVDRRRSLSAPPPPSLLPASEPPKAAAVDDGDLKQRHLGKGDSVNVLCVLKIGNRSVETVVAETSVEAYAVSADDFYGLFNHDNEIDRLTFDDMCAHELQSYRMDSSQPAPTSYGVPLYTTFSCVSVTVVAARGLVAADFSLLGKGTSDPYAVVELVSVGGMGTRTKMHRVLSLGLSPILSLSLSRAFSLASMAR
jgi:CRP-like cAMP-binding protein